LAAGGGGGAAGVEVVVPRPSAAEEVEEQPVWVEGAVASVWLPAAAEAMTSSVLAGGAALVPGAAPPLGGVGGGLSLAEEDCGGFPCSGGGDVVAGAGVEPGVTAAEGEIGFAAGGAPPFVPGGVVDAPLDAVMLGATAAEGVGGFAPGAAGSGWLCMPSLCCPGLVPGGDVVGAAPGAAGD
jgi:hypothetical protein